MENVETELARAEQMLEWVGAFTYKHSEGKFTEGELEVEAELDSEGESKTTDRIFVTPDQSFEGVEDEEEHF